MSASTNETSEPRPDEESELDVYPDVDHVHNYNPVTDMCDVCEKERPDWLVVDNPWHPPTSGLTWAGATRVPTVEQKPRGITRYVVALIVFFIVAQLGARACSEQIAQTPTPVPLTGIEQPFG